MKISKIFLSIVCLCSTSMAVDSEQQFLDFINSTTSNLSTVKETIAGSEMELSKSFIVDFGKCFDGKVISVSSSISELGVLSSAARILGGAFLKDAQSNDNIDSAKKAIAFFRSIPSTVNLSTGSDQCYVNYAQIAEEEKERIVHKNSLLKQLQDSESFFK